MTSDLAGASVLERADTCPLCVQDRLRAADAGDTVRRCQGCGIQVHSPSGSVRIVPPAGEPRRILDEIGRYARTGRFLDANAGRGELLMAAEGLGYDPFGISWDSNDAELARREFGSDRIWRGTLDDAGFDRESFTVGVAAGLLERVLDPIRVLERLRDLLSEGGIVLAVTPDGRSRHLDDGVRIQWNPGALRRAAILTGYRVLSVRYLEASGASGVPFLGGWMRRLHRAGSPLDTRWLVATLRRDDPA